MITIMCSDCGSFDTYSRRSPARKTGEWKCNQCGHTWEVPPPNRVRHAPVYTTFHIQKDKRINLGYCVHKDKSCPALRSRAPVEIAGPIVQMIPKCGHCMSRT